MVSAPHRLYRAYLIPVTGELPGMGRRKVATSVHLTLTTPDCTVGGPLNIGGELGQSVDQSRYHNELRLHTCLVVS